MSGQKLMDLTDEFEGMKSLKEVDLSDNSFVSVPKVLTKLPIEKANFTMTPIKDWKNVKDMNSLVDGGLTFGAGFNSKEKLPEELKTIDHKIHPESFMDVNEENNKK